VAAPVAKYIDEIQRRVNRIDTGWRTRVLEAIDHAVQSFAEKMPWKELRREEIFLAPGTRQMVFPTRVARIITLGDRGNARYVAPGEAWESRSEGSFYQDTIGSPVEWRHAGAVPVISQPTTDAALNVRSTASEAITLYLQGLARDTAASGTALELYPVRESITFNGSAFTGTANTYVQLLDVYKTSNSSADVIINDSVAGTPISRIAGWQDRPNFQSVEFMWIPQSGTQIQASYFTRPEQIVSENQVVDNNVDHDYIVWRAAGDIHWQKEQQQAAQLAWAKAEERLLDLANAAQNFGEIDIRTVPTSNFLDFHDDNELI
jgi:hypothetical protein